MGSCTSKNWGPVYALWTVQENLQTGYMVWPLLKSLTWIALLLWLFEGTVCLWDEIEKQENSTLLGVVNSFRCVWASPSSLPKALHHLLLRSFHAPDFCGNSEELCLCIPSSAQILADAEE